MPPKKGNSSKTSSSFDNKRFISLEAQTKFNKFEEEDKGLVRERALKPIPGDGRILEFIQARKWEALTDTPAPAISSLVREFYANASVDCDHDRVFVREKRISFSSRAINTYYGIQSIDESEDLYDAFWRDDENYTMIIENLCVPGTEWLKGKGNSSKLIAFPKNTLNRYAKAWHKFICSNLMPTSHLNVVTTKRAALLYCIYAEITIDIRKAIRNSLVESIEAKTTGGHTHPCLITALCLKAGVIVKEWELRVNPAATIDSLAISKYICWEGGAPLRSGLGFNIAPANQAPPPRQLLPRLRKTPAVTPSFRTITPGYEQAYQARLRLQQRQLIPTQDNPNDDTGSASSSQDDRNNSRIAAMHQQIIQQGKEIHEIRQEQFRMQQYQSDCFNTFASYFRQLQPDAQFPPLPQFPPSCRNDNDEDQ
ncbi:Retrovirus-related Pol polyprotein from transposon 17.6 [Melia azedarach]|uniref:Retrovirus-related Pol polyprotein from transposon 17.6 n=1 Tax=Melia azedarach TaxID=155640 RepID=A0ACC1YM89_MELAZ|nr:Retrovirus-related Pol polyprotein from transposon 17.6 [Melia azedarach]